MKIVNRAEFFKLPNGCLFANYQPSVWEELSIRDDVMNNDDFIFRHLVDVKSGPYEDFHVGLDDDVYGRDGMYEEKQQFVVFNDDDIKLLIKMLEGALGKVK